MRLISSKLWVSIGDASLAFLTKCTTLSALVELSGSTWCFMASYVWEVVSRRKNFIFCEKVTFWNNNRISIIINLLLIDNTAVYLDIRKSQKKYCRKSLSNTVRTTNSAKR